MKSVKYILLILNCEKYKNKAVRQKKGWLSKLNNNDLIYYHVIGSNKKCNDKEYIFDDINKILYVNTKDDYCSLPNKVISSFNAINNEYNYEYIFKTDDDQNLVKPNFFNSIIKIIENKKNINYGGFLLNVNDHYSRYYLVHSVLPKNLFLKKTSYCSGRFYLLSNKSINHLIKFYDNISQCVIEDHTIGLYLSDEFKSNGLYFDSNKIFKDIE